MLQHIRKWFLNALRLLAFTRFRPIAFLRLPAFLPAF